MTAARGAGPVGWYVHHHGRGHLTRAAAIAPRLAHPVVGLSTLAAPEGFDGWVQLPVDDDGAAAATAGGAFHWAPRRHAGTARRAAALTAWIAAARPRAMVVDVSVEAAVLARLAGVPVVVVALPGDRSDDPHQLAYRLADRILAFWPREVYDPPWLHRWADKIRWLGALSRYDGRPPGAGGGGVVVLGGAGGDGAPRVAPPSWTVLAGAGWRADPWPALCGADVVVTHAGQNALAEVAAARRPAIVVPEPRPFAEQQRTAAALGRAGIAVTTPSWPEPGGWPALLDAARSVGGDRWASWSSGAAAAAAAATIDEVAAAGSAW